MGLMQAKIDWLSFTLLAHTDTSTEDNYHTAIESALYGGLTAPLVEILFHTHWEERSGGRAPYNRSWDIGDSGIVVFTSDKLNHILIECGGKACDYIRERVMMDALLVMVQTRLSRIDIAVDMQTDAQPVEFVEERTGRKARNVALIESDTGQTCYLGSMKSESYIRVYKYAPPHPRSNLLRAEFVFRRKYARVMAGEIIVQGLDNVVTELGRRAGFQHEAWKPEDGLSEKIKFSRPEREASGTLFWLIKSAAPAFKRMVDEGIIENPEEFLATYFLPG